jgi:hypothetical protein
MLNRPGGRLLRQEPSECPPREGRPLPLRRTRCGSHHPRHIEIVLYSLGPSSEGRRAERRYRERLRGPANSRSRLDRAGTSSPTPGQGRLQLGERSGAASRFPTEDLAEGFVERLGLDRLHFGLGGLYLESLQLAPQNGLAPRVLEVVEQTTHGLMRRPR